MKSMVGIRESLGGKKALFLGPIISVLFFSAVIYFSDISEITSEIMGADLLLMGLAVLSGNLPVLVGSLAWKMIFEGAIDEGLWSWLKLKFVCLFVSNSTPFGDLGGEPFVSWIVSTRNGLGLGETLSRVVSADAFENLPYVVFGATNLFLLVFLYGFRPGVGLAGTAWLVGALCLLFVVVLRWNDMILARAPEALRGFFSGLGMVKEKLLTDPVLAASLILAALTSFSLDVITVYLVVLSLDLEVSLFLIFLVVPVARAFNLAPSPGGSGVYEAGFSILISSVSALTFQQAVSVSLVYRGITTYTGLTVGFLALNYGSLKQYNAVPENI